MTKPDALTQFLAIFHRRWMSREEAAEYCGISGTFFDDQIRPLCRAVMLGKRNVFDRSELDSIMESKKMREFK